MNPFNLSGGYVKGTFTVPVLYPRSLSTRQILFTRRKLAFTKWKPLLSFFFSMKSYIPWRPASAPVMKSLQAWGVIGGIVERRMP